MQYVIYCICRHTQIFLFTCGWAVVIVPGDPFQFHTFALVFRQYQVFRCIRDVWKPLQQHGFGKSQTHQSLQQKRPREQMLNQIIPSARGCGTRCIRLPLFLLELKCRKYLKSVIVRKGTAIIKPWSACSWPALVSWHLDPFIDVAYINAAPQGFTDPLTQSRNMAHMFPHLTPWAALKLYLCPLEFLPHMCTHPGLCGLHWQSEEYHPPQSTCCQKDVDTIWLTKL